MRAPTAPPGAELVPRGRTEPFQTEDYDIVPRGAYDIVRHDYYSPVPDVASLPEDIWARRSALGGIDLREDEAMALIETELAPFVAELDVPAAGPVEPGTFYLENQNYETVDAELLYAMIRARKPSRVVELGSGFTTLLIGDAVRRNLAEGAETAHVAYDPYPRRQILGDGPYAPTRFEAISATDVPLSVFEELRDGDVLFVDTTHTVKIGSDVNFVILDVLPRLAAGVHVHFHDIFLPYEYPRAWFDTMGYLWAEQYLLQAFLAYNSAFRVEIPAQAVARAHRERLAAAIPSFRSGGSPAAMWLRRA